MASDPFNYLFKGKKKLPAHYTTEMSEEEDVNVLDESDDDYFEDDWGAYDNGEPDQVAYVDDEGWFYADEDTFNAVDEGIAWDDEAYAQQVTTYTEARNALARARIARGFYPVVSQRTMAGIPDSVEPARRVAVRGKVREKPRRGKPHPNPNPAPTGLGCHRVPPLLVCHQEERADLPPSASDAENEDI